MIAKELRALLPLWVAAVATMLLASALGRDFARLAVPAFFLGIAALGAWPIGHEYSFRTLPALLTLPVPRSRIWVTKLAAAVPLLVALSTVALYILPPRTEWPFGAVTYFLPALAALFIAPWLTMAARSAIAGIIFANSLGAMLLIVGAWIGTKRYGYTAAVDVFQFQFLWWTISALTIVAAVHGFWMFTRLEAVDGRGAEVELRRTRRAAAISAGVTRRHAAWVMVKKELRLQQLAWVFAVLFAAGYVTLYFTKSGTHEFADMATMVVTIHLLVQSLLIGSLAGAEERAYGTHDAQLLLPMSSARQWSLKAGTAIVHALLLSLALPLLLVTVLPPEPLASVRRGPVIPGHMAVMSVVLTSLALYVSTLASSGVRALMISIPVMIGLVAFMQRASTRVSWAAYRLTWEGRSPMFHLERSTSDGIRVLALAALAWFILWRALAHYRWADPRRTRVAMDAAWLAMAAIGFFALTAVLGI